MMTKLACRNSLHKEGKPTCIFHRLPGFPIFDHCPPQTGRQAPAQSPYGAIATLSDHRCTIDTHDAGGQNHAQIGTQVGKTNPACSQICVVHALVIEGLRSQDAINNPNNCFVRHCAIGLLKHCPNGVKQRWWNTSVQKSVWQFSCGEG